ncbi:MAG: hypothetical protein ACK56F_05405 [bacterium]
MAEEHSNIQEADDLLKLANKLHPNSTLELEIEWYMKTNQNGGVQKALKVANSCKPLLSNFLLIMKSVHDIVQKIGIKYFSKSYNSTITSY